MSCAAGGKEQEKTKGTNIVLRGCLKIGWKKVLRMTDWGGVLLVSRWMIMEKVHEVRVSQLSRAVQ